MTGMIPTIVFCIAPLALGMLTLEVIVSHARIKMADQVLLLQEYGLYPAWEKQNKWVLVLEGTNITVFILSFVGIIIFPAFNYDLARAALIPFISCAFFAPIVFGLHYWRVMRVQLPPWLPPPTSPKQDFRNAALVLGVTGLVLYVAHKLGWHKEQI